MAIQKKSLTGNMQSTNKSAPAAKMSKASETAKPVALSKVAASSKIAFAKVAGSRVAFSKIAFSKRTTL